MAGEFCQEVSVTEIYDTAKSPVYFTSGDVNFQ